MKQCCLWFIYIIIVSSIYFSYNYFLPYVDAREFDFWTTGASVILFGTCGILWNLFLISVLLVAKSGFNKLLLGLSKLCPTVWVFRVSSAVLVYLVFRVKSGISGAHMCILNFENIYLESLWTHSNTVFAHFDVTLTPQDASQDAFPEKSGCLKIMKITVL